MGNDGTVLLHQRVESRLLTIWNQSIRMKPIKKSHDSLGCDRVELASAKRFARE